MEAWVGALAWLGLLGGAFGAWASRSIEASDVPFGIALACLCALGTMGGGGLPIRLLGARPLAALGSFSYSLYLMHHPVLQAVYALRPPALDGQGPTLAWLVLLGLPAIAVVAWLFSRVFERPFLRRPARLPRNRRTVPGSLPLPGKS